MARGKISNRIGTELDDEPAGLAGVTESLIKRVDLELALDTDYANAMMLCPPQKFWKLWR